MSEPHPADQTFWPLWRKCGVCGAEIGQPCRSLSGTIAGGRPDGIVTELLKPHHARLPRKGLIMPEKSGGGRDDKAPTSGSNSTQRRDDKATADGKPVDPNRPHTDR